MERISTTHSVIEKRPKFCVKGQASFAPTSEDPHFGLLSAAKENYKSYKEKTVANMIRATVRAVKDAPQLAPEEQLYTGSYDLGMPLLSGCVLDLYKYVMQVYNHPIPEEIEEDAFFLEYYTNIRILNGKFTPTSVKFMGMKPFAYGAMEFDLKDEPDEFMVDFFHNILRLGLVIEEDIESFLNKPPHIQKNVESFLLDKSKVRNLVKSGQHVIFPEESVASTVVLLDSVQRSRAPQPVPSENNKLFKKSAGGTTGCTLRTQPEAAKSAIPADAAPPAPRRSTRIIERMGQTLSTPLLDPLTTLSGQPRRTSSMPYTGRPRGRPKGPGQGAGVYVPTGKSRGRPLGKKNSHHGF